MKQDEQLQTQFVTYLLTEKRVAENTFLAYQRDLKQFLSYLHDRGQSVESCTRKDLKHFVKKMRQDSLAARSVSRKISTLKLFFDFVSDRFAMQNKADLLIFPKIEQGLPLYLTDNELYDLLSAAQQDSSAKGVRNKVIVHVLYATGMRVSELANLRLEQLHFDTGFIRVWGKGNKERMVPLPQATLELLQYYLDAAYRKLQPKKEILDKERYLFPTFIGGRMQPITRQSIWNIIKHLLKVAGIQKNVSPHTLRHSLATHLLKNGANIRAIQLLLGHEKINTVQIYTHLETSQLRKIYDEAHPRSKNDEKG